MHSCFRLLKSILLWQLAPSLTWTEEKIIMSRNEWLCFSYFGHEKNLFSWAHHLSLQTPNKAIQCYFLQSMPGFPGEFQAGLILRLGNFQRRARYILQCPVASNMVMKSSVLARLGMGKTPEVKPRVKTLPCPCPSSQGGGQTAVTLKSLLCQQ